MASDGFRDRNHRYGYLVARENARRIAEDPAVLEAGRRHLDRFSRGDPAQRDGYALWSSLLDAGAEAVVARLTERGARGDYARETAPSFGGLAGPVRARLSREAVLQDALARGLDDLEAGRVHDADEVFDELEARYAASAPDPSAP